MPRKSYSDNKQKAIKILKATHTGKLELGNFIFNCCVLEDGTRIISEGAIMSHLGTSGGRCIKRKKKLEKDMGPTPLFIASKPLKPFIDASFEQGGLSPVQYLQNGKIHTGYKAEILPKVCEVWLQARDAGVLQSQQLPKVKKAEILMRALAHVGLSALIDEVTKYQAIRSDDALAKMLEKFIATELRPWSKTFPNQFYQQICRLKKVEYIDGARNLPPYFGGITNDLIYERLAPGILEELKRILPKDDNGKREGYLHQKLTVDTGHPKLREHIASVVTLMKLSKNWHEFKDKLEMIHPKYMLNMFSNQILLF